MAAAVPLSWVLFIVFWLVSPVQTQLIPGGRELLHWHKTGEEEKPKPLDIAIYEDFRMFESNGDGFLDKDEVGRLMGHHKQPNDEDSVNDFVKKYDDDKDGKVTYAEAIPAWYPGRPTGTCTSRGHTCNELVENQPQHVKIPNQCKTARAKTLRDRFGRPLTIRYTYAKRTYVANREQVCDLASHMVQTNISLRVAQIDDFIWKNLSIWSKEFEHMWENPAAKEQYVKCHAQFAAFHCSSMFPNCTAEYADRKPALPCKELCDDAMNECTWAGHMFFLPYKLQCDQYPSRFDPYKKCTHVKATLQYIERIAAAPTAHHLSTIVPFLAIAALQYIFG